MIAWGEVVLYCPNWRAVRKCPTRFSLLVESALSKVTDQFDKTGIRAEIGTEIGDALCAIIMAALPLAKQSVKWNAPNFSLAGQDLITLNFLPNKPLRIVFHRGAKAVDTKTGVRLVPDETGRLTWATDQRAYASFAHLSEVHAQAVWLTDFCQRWAQAAQD
jgi:Domain of unknown function (DU1801)